VSLSYTPGGTASNVNSPRSFVAVVATSEAPCYSWTLKMPESVASAGNIWP
jgi:hypothetical protein